VKEEVRNRRSDMIGLKYCALKVEQFSFLPSCVLTLVQCYYIIDDKRTCLNRCLEPRSRFAPLSCSKSDAAFPWLDNEFD